MATMSDWFVIIISVVVLASLLTFLMFSLNNLTFWKELVTEMYALGNVKACIDKAIAYENCTSTVDVEVILEGKYMKTKHFTIHNGIEAEGRVIGEYTCKNNGVVICSVK